MISNYVDFNMNPFINENEPDIGIEISEINVKNEVFFKYSNNKATIDDL